MRNLLFLTILLFTFANSIVGQIMIENSRVFDTEKLNEFIITELNKLRKKARVDALENDPILLSAAQDHADYIARKKKLKHTQLKRKKKTPKNRIDFYGGGYELVGENIQYFDLKTPVKMKGDKEALPMDTYERIAKQLVLNWKNSKPHFENIISENFTNTYTSVNLDENGNLYACQLFGDQPFTLPYEVKVENGYTYKQERLWRCWRSFLFYPQGTIEVDEDGAIFFRVKRKVFLWPKIGGNLKLMNARHNFDGLAADIVVKSQYTCDETNNFNGALGVTGVSLEPVWRKDYSKATFISGRIYLGQVPDWVDEEFEVNLTVINNKRTCQNYVYHVIPTYFGIDFDLEFDLKLAPENYQVELFDTLYKRVHYTKDSYAISDSLLATIDKTLKEANKTITKIEIDGFASIEGSTENNLILQQERANNIVKQLKQFDIDTTKIKITTAENFEEFREDIKGTEYDSLGNLNNANLKKFVNRNSTDFESFLGKHRYASVRLFLKDIDTVDFTQQIAEREIKKAIEEGNKSRVEELQTVFFDLVDGNKMEIEDLKNIKVPFTKTYLNYKINEELFFFISDTITIERLGALKANLTQLKLVDNENKQLNTNLLVLDYFIYSHKGISPKEVRRFIFDSIPQYKKADKEIAARVALSLAVNNDVILRGSGYKLKNKRYLYNDVKRFINTARLSPDQTVDLASFYTYLDQNRYAYKISKPVIRKVNDPENLIYFLKLIELTDAKPSRSLYLSLFEKVKRVNPERFCTYFNSPGLNFQILNDPEIKEIYCEACNK